MFNTDKTSLHRRLLADAWHISWEHKHLWLFGFFATFVGFGSVSEIVFKAFNRMIDLVPTLQWLDSPVYLLPGGMTMAAIVRFSPYPALTALLFFFIAAIFFSIFVWAAIISVNALIANADRLHRNKDVVFSEGVKLGAPGFWRVLCLVVLAKLAIGAAVLLTGSNLVTLVREASVPSTFFFLLSLIIFTAIAVALSIAVVYAAIEVVTKNAKLEAAFRSGWQLFVKNWLVSLEMMLLLLGVNVVVGLVILAGLLVLSVPFIFLMLFSAFFAATGAIMALTTLGFAIILIALVVYGSFMTVFQITAWTRLYDELAVCGSHSWLARLACLLEIRRK